MSEILKNENLNTIKYGNIEFKIIGESNSNLIDIPFILDGKFDIAEFNEKENKKEFNDIVLYHLFANHFLLEYDSEFQREKNKKLFQEKFEPIEKSFNSVEQADGSQIPQYYSEFEYNGKYYLVTVALNKIIDTSETNPELGIYKGVIVNPELYFGEVGEEAGKVKDKLDKLI